MRTALDKAKCFFQGVVLLAFAVAAAMYFYESHETEGQLAIHGKVVEGVVGEYRPQTVHLGKRGSRIAHRHVIAFDHHRAVLELPKQTALGTSLILTYDPKHPEQVMVGLAGWKWTGYAWRMVVLLALFVAGMAMFLQCFERRPRDRGDGYWTVSGEELRQQHHQQPGLAPLRQGPRSPSQAPENRQVWQPHPHSLYARQSQLKSEYRLPKAFQHLESPAGYKQA